MAGRLLRMFFTKDDTTSLSTFEFSNYTVQGSMFPRADLPDFKARTDSNKPGVYLIFNDNNDDGLLYIGEGDPVIPRLLDHNAKKDFWTHAIVFTSKDENLTKTQIQFLEAKLIEKADSAKRIKLDNTQRPAIPSLSESGLSEVELFLDLILDMLTALRFSFFEPLSTVVTISTTDIIYELRVKEAFGKMVVKNGKYILLKGSTLQKKYGTRAKDSIKKMRQQLIDSGYIVQHSDDLLIVTEDIEFSSASYAANAVAGYNLNGLDVWKHKDKSLKEITSEE